MTKIKHAIRQATFENNLKNSKTLIYYMFLYSKHFKPINHRIQAALFCGFKFFYKNKNCKFMCTEAFKNYKFKCPKIAVFQKTTQFHAGTSYGIAISVHSLL